MDAGICLDHYRHQQQLFLFCCCYYIKEYIRKKNALFVLTKVLNDSDLFFIFLLFF